MAELKPVYLVVGSDRPKIGRALERLRGRIGEDALEQLSAQESGGGDVVAACNALGLFGEGARLVRVDAVERWKAADVKALAEYLQMPAPGTVVALTGDVKPDSALGKACAKFGEVLVYDVPKRALPTWVGEQFARLGAKADQAACVALVELVGDDLEELENEAEKLSTWAAGEQLTARHVRELAAGRAETSAFVLTDAWGRRDVGAAVAASEELLERSGRPRRSEVPRLAALLTNHVMRVRACQELAAEGLGAREAAARLRMHRFAAEKAFAHSRNFDVDELRDALIRLAELDRALKGGSRLAPELELQRALAEMTRPRSPAAATDAGER